MAVVMSTDLLRQAAAKLRDPLLCNFPTKVGLPLANWLESTAGGYRTEVDTPECPNCGEGCAGHEPETYHYTCGAPAPCECITSALAVAEAVLGDWWD